MTLLHLLNPLSPKSLDRCIELLRSNPKSEPIDYMRIFALQYASIKDEKKRAEIVLQCSALFDLDSRKELLIFSRWLARLGEFQRLIEYLPSAKARVDEDLFKLRMNALAQVGDLERIHTEVANAPLIPTLWRMVVEARAYAMQEKYSDSKDVLDRLIPYSVMTLAKFAVSASISKHQKISEDSVMFWRNSVNNPSTHGLL